MKRGMICRIDAEINVLSRMNALLLAALTCDGESLIRNSILLPSFGQNSSQQYEHGYLRIPHRRRDRKLNYRTPRSWQACLGTAESRRVL